MEWSYNEDKKSYSFIRLVKPDRSMGGAPWYRMVDFITYANGNYGVKRTEGRLDDSGQIDKLGPTEKAFVCSRKYYDEEYSEYLEAGFTRYGLYDADIFGFNKKVGE